jgi:hypothetical protein
MTNLFKINTTDLTKWEDTTKHKVNRADVYTTWTDGNWIDHREIVRTKITGTVVLSFSRETDFSNFISLMSTARNADGYYPITVWCSNTNTTETINAFLDISGDTVWDVTAPIKHHDITVTITGR